MALEDTDSTQIHLITPLPPPPTWASSGSTSDYAGWKVSATNEKQYPKERSDVLLENSECYWQSGSLETSQTPSCKWRGYETQHNKHFQTFRNLLEGKSPTILCHLAAWRTFVMWLGSTRVISPCGKGQQTASQRMTRPRKGMRIHLPSPGSQDSSVSSYSSGRHSGCVCMSISDTYYVWLCTHYVIMNAS